MINEDEDALICDLAEIYNIHDYKQLPLTKVAVFANGLKDDSRIKLKLNGQKLPVDTLLLMGLVDRLSILLWSRTQDGHKGQNRPTMLLGPSTKVESNDFVIFDSGEDFEKVRNNLIKAGGE